MSKIKFNKNSSKHYGDVIEKFGEFNVINCNNCGFFHVDPLPTHAELIDLYKNEYYSKEKPFYIERYVEDLEWWNCIYNSRYEYFESKIVSNNKSILDVGSGPGLFLKRGKERGWITTGIEPSEQAAEYSQKKLGLNIIKCFLTEDLLGKLKKYDVVNMGEVLEHLPEPAKMLGMAHKLLNKGGILSIIVPNDFNPFQQILRKHHNFAPWWISYPHHLNYFSPETLTNFVNSCGFKVIDIHTTFPIDIFLLMGKNYIGNDEVGRDIHAMRKEFEIKMLNADGKISNLLIKMYKELSKLGVGREIVLYAVKI